MDGWNTTVVSFWDGLFSVAMFVSGSVIHGSSVRSLISRQTKHQLSELTVQLIPLKTKKQIHLLFSFDKSFVPLPPKITTFNLHKPPKFNIAPEKWWLEDYFPIGKEKFSGGNC